MNSGASRVREAGGPGLRPLLLRGKFPQRASGPAGRFCRGRGSSVPPGGHFSVTCGNAPFCSAHHIPPWIWVQPQGPGTPSGIWSGPRHILTDSGRECHLVTHSQLLKEPDPAPSSANPETHHPLKLHSAPPRQAL